MCKWGRHCCQPHSHRLRSPAFRHPLRRAKSPGARAGTRSRQEGVGTRRCLFTRPGGSAVGQSVGALRFISYAASRSLEHFHPRRAGHSGLRHTRNRISSAGERTDLKIATLLPASKSRSVDCRVEILKLYCLISGFYTFNQTFELSSSDDLKLRLLSESFKPLGTELSTFNHITCG